MQKKIWTMLLGAQIVLAPAPAAQAAQVAPAVQPVLAPHVAPEAQPQVAPQVAPEVAPAVGPQVAPTVTVAPEANLPFSNPNFEAAAYPTIMPVVRIPLPGHINAA